MPEQSLKSVLFLVSSTPYKICVTVASRRILVHKCNRPLNLPELKTNLHSCKHVSDDVNVRWVDEEIERISTGGKRIRVYCVKKKMEWLVTTVAKGALTDYELFKRRQNMERRVSRTIWSQVGTYVTQSQGNPFQEPLYNLGEQEIFALLTIWLSKAPRCWHLQVTTCQQRESSQIILEASTSPF
jgi:hypothetical protein